MTLWFIADTHFGHKNILRYCDRPFKGIKEHDETIIRNWNSVVQPDDFVYHLGDFAFASPGYIISILERLAGRKIFIRGNHDKKMKGKEILDHFEEVHDYVKELNIYDDEMEVNQFVVMCHYPFASWNKSFHGSWCCHGHVHGRFEEHNKSIPRVDVGVDIRKFTPISYQEVKEIITRKALKKIGEK